MSILNRYLGRSLLTGWLLTLVVLSVIFGILALIQEMERVLGAYQLPQVFGFIISTIPQRAVDLAPVIAFLGSLLGFAALARHYEFVVAWASGLTVRRLLMATAVPVAALVISLALVIEYIAAPLSQGAELRRNLQRSGAIHEVKGGGLWSNDGNRFFSVQRLYLGHIPQGIDLYEFGPDRQLTRAIHATQAEVGDDRQWVLMDVHYQERVNGQLTTRHLAELPMGPLWQPDELAALALSPASMSLSGLWTYSRHLRNTGQHSEPFEKKFWQKAFIPLTAGAMVLLAIPLAAGPASPRSGHLARQLATGSLAGILFYLGSKISVTMGVLLALPQPVIASLPVLFILGLSSYLFYRLERGKFKS